MEIIDKILIFIITIISILNVIVGIKIINFIKIKKERNSFNYHLGFKSINNGSYMIPSYVKYEYILYSEVMIDPETLFKLQNYILYEVTKNDNIINDFINCNYKKNKKGKKDWFNNLLDDKTRLEIINTETYEYISKKQSKGIFNFL